MIIRKKALAEAKAQSKGNTHNKSKVADSYCTDDDVKLPAPVPQPATTTTTTTSMSNATVVSPRATNAAPAFLHPRMKILDVDESPERSRTPQLPIVLPRTEEEKAVITSKLSPHKNQATTKE